MTEPARAAPASPQPITTTAQFVKLFTSVMLPMFLAAIDQTLLATATPVVAAELGGLRDTSWIAVGYLLAAAATTPVYGRFGDRYGRRNVLLVALGIFTLGSLACAAAQSLLMLIVARVVQGLGGGGLMTLSQALIGELVTPRERARFQGYFAAMFSIASIGGPVIGSLVVQHASWRWLFLANVPLVALAAWRLLALPPGKKGDGTGTQDYTGILLFAAGIVTLLFWLSSAGHRFGWASVMSLVLLCGSVALLGVLALHERRHPKPFLPVELLRQPGIVFCALTTMAFAACMFAMVFFLPVYLQLGLSTGVTTSGLLLLPVTVGIVLGSTTSGRIVAKTASPHWVPVVGMTVAAATLSLLGFLAPSAATIAVLGVVVGAGFGTVMPMMQVTVQTLAGRERLGAATSIVSLSRSLGGAAGTALFGAIVFAFFPETDLAHLGTSISELPKAALLSAFEVAFLAAAAIALMSAFAASRIPKVELK